MSDVKPKLYFAWQLCVIVTLTPIKLLTIAHSNRLVFSNKPIWYYQTKINLIFLKSGAICSYLKRKGINWAYNALERIEKNTAADVSPTTVKSLI